MTEYTYRESADFIRSKLPETYRNMQLGIICGSGLGGIVEVIEPSTRIEIPYRQIPHFVQTTVEGHDGKLVFGEVGKSRTKTVCMVGRCHFYEGYTMQQITFPVRVMALLGVECLVVTNACGALQPEHKELDIVVIHDHLFLPGLIGHHPLRGNNIDIFGPRFPDISKVYSYELRKLAFESARDENISKDDIHEGVYCMYSGPSFETPAEARYLASVGVDAVGMSTVPEVIVAGHAGIKVLALGLITLNVNKQRGNSAKLEVFGNVSQQEDIKIAAASHTKVLESSSKRIKDLEKMIRRFVDLFGSDQKK